MDCLKIVKARLLDMLYCEKSVKMCVGDHIFAFNSQDLVDRMEKMRHDNSWHHGESILEHTAEVYEQIQKTQCESQHRLELVWASLFHDIGKAYTYVLDPERQVHTTHNHEIYSYAIFSGIMCDNSDDVNQTLIEELILHHDDFFRLFNHRKESGSLKYLDNFMRNEIVARQPYLDLLKELALADGHASPRKEESIAQINAVWIDMQKWTIAETSRIFAQYRQLGQTETNKILCAKTIIEMIEGSKKARHAAMLYPDIKAINRELGIAKEYDIIKQIKKILEKEQINT